MNIFKELDTNYVPQGTVPEGGARIFRSPSREHMTYHHSPEEFPLQDLLLWLERKGVDPSQVTLDGAEGTGGGGIIYITWTTEDDD